MGRTDNGKNSVGRNLGEIVESRFFFTSRIPENKTQKLQRVFGGETRGNQLTFPNFQLSIK